MTIRRKTHNPGDIVKMAGINFVVLDNNMAHDTSSGEILFILSVNSQCRTKFGKNTNYAFSRVRKQTDEWLRSLESKGIDRNEIRCRKLDLMTLDGYRGYGDIDVVAAPLTLDEARKYSDRIPECDDATWLATGYERLGRSVENQVLVYKREGGLFFSSINRNKWGIRPALIVPSFLLDDGGHEKKVDLSEASNDELLDEVRRRFDKEGGEM